MTNFSLLRLTLLLLLSLAGLAPALAQTRPDGVGYVVRDYAGVLPEPVRERLERRLIAYADSTGTEIAVVTVASLHGGEVAQVGDSLKNALGVGSKRDQTGILYLIAPAEHKQTIRVGRGMEPYLTDAECRRILDGTRPKASQDLPAAVEARVLAIIRQIAPDQPELAQDRGRHEQAEQMAEQMAEQGPDMTGLLGTGLLLGLLILGVGLAAKASAGGTLDWPDESDESEPRGPKRAEQPAKEAPAGKWRNRKQLARKGVSGPGSTPAPEAKSPEPAPTHRADDGLIAGIILGSLLDSDEPRKSSSSGSDSFSFGADSDSGGSGGGFSFGGDSDSGGGGASSSDW